MPTKAKLALLSLAALTLPGATPAPHKEHAEHAPRAAATNPAPAAAPAPAQAHGLHWGYEGHAGPENWGELSEDFKACKVGHMQSPVDLGGAEIKGSFSVRTAYKAGPLTILNNGHTVQVTFQPGSVLTSGIARYKLLQVHFHTPSEETIYGVPYPMVAHFVHVDHAGNLAVLGVLFEEGAFNAELDKLIKLAPRQQTAAQTFDTISFDPAKLLPSNLAVYRYEGSLTTPPCTEGVRWHVATHPVSASAGQIAALHAIMGDNARPTQPLHGRLLVAGTD